MKQKVYILLLGCLFLLVMAIVAVSLFNPIYMGESSEKAAMQGDPLWVNGNEHLISQMKYSVDHLSGQINGMDTWLQMAKGESSLLIYSTWLNRLDAMMLATPVDIAEIRHELGESDKDKLLVLDQFEAKFKKARAFIRFGVKHQNQKAIDNGVLILKDLIEIMKSKMDWK